MTDYRIGIDVGGTFTDIVGLSDGHLVRRKVRSTPDDFSVAVLEGLRLILEEVGTSGPQVKEVIHGTTVATNAIVEKKGARTGLSTTQGFRDVLEIARLRTPRLYDLTWRKPPPLVPRELRREATERMTTDGAVLTPLDEESVRQAAEALTKRGVSSIAICFINSFANPSHERQAAEVVRALAPHVSLSVSYQVLPEMREYERTSTAVINAYIRPVVDSYLGALEEGLGAMGVEAPLMMMQSSGGLMSAALARERPAYIVESGPVAGVMGSLHLAQRLGSGPSLVPEDVSERATMMGLCSELIGENGWVWNMRLIMLGLGGPERVAKQAKQNPMYAQYGYSERARSEALERARIALGFLGDQARRQRESGSRYLIGQQLSAADVYWAYFSLILRTLPEEQCAMPSSLRKGYDRASEALGAVDELLIEYRDWTFAHHLPLPMEF